MIHAGVPLRGQHSVHAIAGVGGNLCRLPEAHGGVNQIVQDQAGGSVSLFRNRVVVS